MEYFLLVPTLQRGNSGLTLCVRLLRHWQFLRRYLHVGDWPLAVLDAERPQLALPRWSVGARERKPERGSYKKIEGRGCER